MKLIELWVWLLKGRQYVTMVRAVGPKEWVQQVGWFSKSCNKMAVVGLSRRAASYLIICDSNSLSIKPK